MPSKVEGRRFDVGAIVMAKWPRTKLYFKGLILDYNDIEYLVRFDDDDQSELAIKYKDVQSPFKNRSRSRSLGRTPGISPSRKSPGRKSPSRKSPGRKSPSRKSPSRRSPARQSPPMKSPSRKSRAEKEETTSSSHLSRISIREKEEKSASLNEEKDASFALRNRAQVTADISVSRHAAHISTFEKKIPYADGKSNSSSSSNSIKVDTKEVIKSVQEKNRIVEALKRFAIGVWVTLKALPLAAVVVTFPFLLSLLCSTKKCSVQLPDIPRRLSFYYDQNALIIAGTYILSLLILAFVPIGKTVKTKTGSRIRCNGYLSLMAVSIAICVFLKMGYKSASVYLLYQPFMIAFTGLGIVISFLLYFKAFYARRDNLNPHGNTGYYLVDFIEGREVSPRIGSFDLKFFLFRIMLINIILINFLVVAKDLQGKQGHYSPTLLVVAGMQVFYAFDHVLFEDSYLTTYEYMNHGVGFVTCVGYLVAAFTATIYSRYVHNHGSELPWYYLVGIVGVNLFGYTILRGANSQKHAFKTNPADPALVHLESLPTSTGKRLLVSGWWGLVRHPNYLGDMIVQISWALICGFNHNIPWIVATTSIIYLLTRIFVVEKMCKAKYGLAWSSYTSRVPYRLLPKVF